MGSERALEPYCMRRVDFRTPTTRSLISRQDERRMARFAQYAMVASEEALKDAGWYPKEEEELEATV